MRRAGFTLTCALVAIIFLAAAYATRCAGRRPTGPATKHEEKRTQPSRHPDADECAPPAEGDCRATYEHVLRGVSKILLEEGLMGNPVPSGMTYETRYDRYYRARLGVLGKGSQTAPEMWFIGRPCRPILLLNNLASGSAYGPNANLYDAPTRPRWPRERAVAIANKLLPALVDRDQLKLLKLQQARYDHPSMEAPRYYVGQWSFWWARTDSEGHEFMNDGAWVSLLERYGLLLFRLSWHSLYEGPPAKPLEKEQAEERAMPYARRIMQWPPGSGRFAGFALGRQTAATLRVISPNHILDLKSLEELANPGDRNARLAWVVTFLARYAGPREPGHLFPVDAEIYVWLDAETGELLGGDFK